MNHPAISQPSLPSRPCAAHEAATRDDRKALRQIAARLLGLADLAECASRRALPILWLLLWILRPAEAVARALVIKASHDLGAPMPAFALDAPAPAFGGGSRADAVRLALVFRMLAALVDGLAALAAVSRQTIRHFRLLLSESLTGHVPAMPWCLAGCAYHDTS